MWLSDKFSVCSSAAARRALAAEAPPASSSTSSRKGKGIPKAQKNHMKETLLALISGAPLNLVMLHSVLEDAMIQNSMQTCLNCAGESLRCEPGKLGQQCTKKLNASYAYFQSAIAYGIGLNSIPGLADLGKQIDNADLACHASSFHYFLDYVCHIHLRVQMVNCLEEFAKVNPDFSYFTAVGIFPADYTEESFCELCILARKVESQVLPEPENAVAFEDALLDTLAGHLTIMNPLLGKFPRPKNGEVVVLCEFLDRMMVANMCNFQIDKKDSTVGADCA
ncbi:hypothetical protein BDQ17DRAFT_1437260 [Cyathus striatus]|nr:hypothetical protein BDQ17DRAFT_1437260 [Cyathus striatus]